MHMNHMLLIYHVFMVENSANTTKFSPRNVLWLSSSPDLNLSIMTLETKALFTLKAPIASEVVCFSRQLKCLRSLYDRQCRLIWVHPVCFYT